MSQVSYGTITITDTTDIEDVFLIYKGSSSNTVAPSIVWSDNTHNDWETDITQVTGDYIWAITVFKRTGITITNSNYTDYYSDPACLTGEPGTSINITSIKYSTLTTQVQPADNTFTLTSPPTVPEGEWLWSRTLFSNGQSMYSKAKQGKSPTVSKTGNTVTITGADGNTVTVTDGASGQSYYTHIRYATDSSGSNMDSSPTGKTYIGVYSGTSSTAPTTPSSYTWSKYVGDNGTSITISSIKYAKSTTDSRPNDSSFNTSMPSVGEGEWLWTMTTYSDGSKIYTKSKQGQSGTSVTVSKIEYQSGTSPTTAPTGTWSTSIPTVAEGNYLWTKTTYSDNNYSYTVAKQGQSGAPGTSVTIVSTSVQYQVGSSATTAPTGTWQNNPQATTTGQYLWTRTIVNYSDNTSTTSYSVSAHGATGTSISISSIKYAKSTTDSQPADSSFGTSIPNVGEGEWLWTMTTYSNGSKMYTKSKQGATGPQGVSVTSVRELYYLTAGTAPSKPTSSTTIYDDDRVGAWTSVVPSYIVDGNYYISLETTLSNSTKVWSDVILDQALTDANYNAYLAQSLSQNANENANGALSQANSNINSVIRLWQAKSIHSVPNAPSSEVTTGSTSTYNTWSTAKPTATDTYRYFYYCDQSKTGGGVCSWSEVIEDTSYLSTYEINALNVRTKNFFKGLDNTYDGWFASGRLTSEGLNESNAETYLYNARFAATHISLGYNKTPIIDLNGSSGAIDIYRFPTINSNTGLVTAAGSLGMKLSATDLIFYKPPVGNNSPVAAATLNASGLNITDGSIELDNGTNSPIKISNTDFNRSINNVSRSNLRMAIGSNFGVKNDGTLYASNAVISGIIAIGSGSTIDSGATVGGTSLSDIAQNASTGAQAASDLSDFETTVSNTYATQEALSNVEGEIPDVSGLASKTDTVKSVTTETQYRLSDSSTGLTGSGTGYSWSTTIPTWSSNKYLWTRIATTYTPITGNATTVYKPGTQTNEYGIYDSQLTVALSTASSAQTTANGAAASVTTTQQYNLSSSTSSANGTWQDAVPTWSANNYIWVRLKIVKTPMSGTATTSYTPSESGTYDKALTTALSTAASAKTTAENAAPKSSAVAKTQQIYYRSNSDSKPTVYPTAWVTAETNKWNNGNVSETDFNGWRRKVTPISDGIGENVTKYLYLWTATQKQMVNGDIIALTANDIALDDSTTVIDGGKIITGSVSANSINASSGTFDTALIPQLTISKINTLQTVLDGKAASGAENTALSYLSYDSTNGLKIAGSNPSTTTTNYIQITGNNINIVKSSTYKVTIDATNGLLIYAGDASNAVAQFGSTMRIGKTNNSAFYVNSNSLQAYYMNGSTRTKYFEVSPTSLTYGAYTAASTTYADEKASAAEANASYSVEIQVTAIDYANNSATLVAIPYYQGSTILPSGVTLSYQWYKNGTALENTNINPTISGAGTNTLQLGQGTDFGSSSTNAIYTCVIS